ncbi:MAG: hypothetical protein IPM77_12025 [Crocinitomicaceae bacterium]|nr:hypothetical protein [Crocinitomicaceae bacterium]
MIGADFEKIQFVLFGLNLVEPMAFITDLIMGTVSIILGMKVSKIQSNHAFYIYWKSFFYLFGIGALAGGVGHTFFFYFGIPGKFLSWICGPLSVYLLEQAMISINPKEKKLEILKLISSLKMIVVFIIFGVILYNMSSTSKPELPFLPIAINTILGVVLTAGALALSYKKSISTKFSYIYLGVLVMLPTAFIFLLKINLHQWFDKNDLSHVLLTAGIIYFYIGIRKISEDRTEFQSN